jgi:hypothetical protein
MNRRQFESDIEQKHREIAKAAGWFVEKIERTTRGGFPDRFYARAGRVVLIEFKRPGGRASKQQELRHAELRRAGVEVHIAYSVEQANQVLGIRDLAHRGKRDTDTGADDH